MNSATEEFKTFAVGWREQKNRISLFFVKSMAMFMVFLIVVLIAWELCAFKGQDEGTSQTLKTLAAVRQIRSIWETKSSYGKTTQKDSTCFTKQCIDEGHFLLELINQSPATEGYGPCDDFYNFTCGNDTGNIGRNKLQKSVIQTIEGLIKNPIDDIDSEYVILQKKFYQACMDLRAIEEDNNEIFKRKLRRAAKWPLLDGNQWIESEFEWWEAMERCREEGLYFNMLLTVDGCKMVNVTDDSISYVLEVSPPPKVYRVEPHLKQYYAELVVTVLKMVGAPRNILDMYEDMRKVVKFEIDLTNILEATSPDDAYFDKTMADIENGYPFIPWRSFFSDVKMKENTKILFNADAYLIKLKELLEKTSKRDLANYMLWKAVENTAPYLSSNIRLEFERYARRSTRYRFPVNRIDFCYRSANFMFSYTSEAEYVSRHVAEKRGVKSMLDRMVSVLRRYIEYYNWPDEDKEIARSKLESMEFIIGGPREMYDVSEFAKLMGYDTFNISHLHNILEIVCEVNRKRAIYGTNFVTSKHPIHQETIYREVSRVDGLKYSVSRNKLMVPAATMKGFLFSIKRPNYLNYGALGTIIGHELARVFGQKGYKPHGNRVVPVNAITDCLLSTCNYIGVKNRFPMNCNDTFEENFADYIGVQIASEAYRELYDIGEEKSLPGLIYTPTQLFWIAHASAICDNSRSAKPGYRLPFQRLIGTLRHIDDFAQDFQCPLGTVMNPLGKCQLMKQ